jgi:hypothetical protein
MRYLITLLLSSLVGYANGYFEEYFLWGREGALAMSLSNEGGGGPKKVW